MAVYDTDYKLYYRQQLRQLRLCRPPGLPPLGYWASGEP